mgnify:CR=1 FL=1
MQKYGIVLTLGDDPFPSVLLPLEQLEQYPHIHCLLSGRDLAQSDGYYKPTRYLFDQVSLLLSTLVGLDRQSIFFNDCPAPGQLDWRPEIKITAIAQSHPVGDRIKYNLVMRHRDVTAEMMSNHIISADREMLLDNKAVEEADSIAQRFPTFLRT